MLQKFFLLTFLLACATPIYAQHSTVFRHNVAGDVLPWTHGRFDAAKDKFTFAVFSDLTGGERERVFEIAIAQLAMLRPELIINVGDLIEGGNDDVDDIKQQ